MSIKELEDEYLVLFFKKYETKIKDGVYTTADKMIYREYVKEMKSRGYEVEDLE